jgi:SOS response regulatory protein OraA/RecX
MALRKLPSTQKEWFDVALFYCSKRETSRPKLRYYLIRKMRELKPSDAVTEEALRFIEGVLDEFERLKIIDHERYAGMLTREYARRGKGSRYVVGKLYQRGLKEQVEKLEVVPEEEIARAVELARKTLNTTRFKKIEDPREIRTKLLQKLVAAGFSMDHARAAIAAVNL